MIASYVLSRTLVPTMAHFLLRNQTHGHDASDGAKRPSRNPLVWFQRAFERGFEALRQRYVGLLHLGLRKRVWLIGGFLVVAGLSFGLAPFLGSNFFPNIDSGEIKLHVRGQTGTAGREHDRACSRPSRPAIRKIIPRERAQERRRQHRPADLGHQHRLWQFGHDRQRGCGPPHHAQRGTRADRGIRAHVAQASCRSSFPASPSPSCRRTSSRRSSISARPRRSTCRSSARTSTPITLSPTRCSRDMRGVTGLADGRIQQAFQQPTLNVAFNRTMASLVGLNEQSAATQHVADAGREQPDQSDLLAQSRQSDFLSGLDPDAAIRDGQSRRSARRSADGQRPAAQLLGGLATFDPTASHAVVSHYNIQPVIDIYATPVDRDLGAVADDVTQNHGRHAAGAAARLATRAARPGRDDAIGLSAALHRHRLCDRADLPARSSSTSSRGSIRW